MTNDRPGQPPVPIDADSQLPPQSGGWNFFVVLLLVAGFGYFMATLLRIPPENDQHVPAPGPGLIGMKAPAIKTQGWFNGTAPTDEDLRGKVIVIDAWAYWCGPCRRKAPGLIKLYEKYGSKGVVFLGLTSEDRRALKQSEEFIADLKIPWPQGYGADATLARLNTEYIPQVWIIDQKGTIVWDQTATEDLDTALARLLP
ncbi:MAG: TlpA disulfide reductase family protein [Planctomycetaceae bacterium]|nr:TlpA disulfide reductase family protein [Planctomycetaceae bacterium]